MGITEQSTTVNRRVVLVSPYGIENRGVRYISAVLRQNGFEPQLVLFKRWVNNQIEAPTPAEESLLCDLVADIDPILVGFGFGAPYLAIVTRLTELIKERVSVLVLWGGVHPTVCPEDCIEHADAVCIGEGEYPTLDLCKALADEDDFAQIPGLWVRRNGEVVRNEARPLMQDLDALPLPDYMQPGTWFIEDGKCRGRDPIAGTAEYRIYPTRGCPYACTYCHNSVLRSIFDGKGRYYRVRGAENVLQELEAARKLFPRLRRVKFDGDVFAFPKNWLREFCDGYRKRIGIPFEILTYPGELDEQDLGLLKHAGLQKIQTGIQSGSDQEVREVYGRRSTADDIRNLARVAHQVGVEVVFDVIFDDPLAQSADKQAIVELLLEIQRPFRIYLYSLTVFPKTAIARELLATGIITPDDVEGKATKSFRQFRLSLDYPRSKEDVFWIGLTILSSKSFVPRAFVRRAMRSDRLRAHPGPVKFAAQAADLLKTAAIATQMLLNGELTFFKIHQYGSLRKLISQ